MRYSSALVIVFRFFLTRTTEKKTIYLGILKNISNHTTIDKSRAGLEYVTKTGKRSVLTKTINL